jgi:hypothetical protein
MKIFICSEIILFNTEFIHFFIFPSYLVYSPKCKNFINVIKSTFHILQQLSSMVTGDDCQRCLEPFGLSQARFCDFCGCPRKFKTSPEQTMNNYEHQRNLNIQRNNAMMKCPGLKREQILSIREIANKESSM